MERRRDEAYVLATQALGDADLIVTLLAHHAGKVRAVARSARRSRRRFGGYLEPLTRVETIWVEREGRELHRLESIEGRRSFAEMQADPLRQAACAVLAEVTICFAQEGHGEPETFRLLGAVLEALEHGGRPRSLLRYFEYWTLRIHGLLPDLGSCGSCSRPLDAVRRVTLRPGVGLLCGDCAGRGASDETRFGGEDRARLERIRREPPAGLASDPDFRVSRALERLLRGTLEAYAERTFRSYRHFNAAESPTAAP